MLQPLVLKAAVLDIKLLRKQLVLSSIASIFYPEDIVLTLSKGVCGYYICIF